MVKSIEELKLLIVDRMVLKSKNGNKIEIRRFPNNIIKIFNKSVTWIYLQDLIANSEYSLIVNENQEELNLEKQYNWGGRRLAGPGKTLGRPKKGDKKKLVGIYMDEATRYKFNIICHQLKKKKSDLISELIREYFYRKIN